MLCHIKKGFIIGKDLVPDPPNKGINPYSGSYKKVKDLGLIRIRNIPLN
jgi:hypothetical protein